MDDRTSGYTFTSNTGVRPLPLGVPSQAITKQPQLYTVANTPGVSCPSGPGLNVPILTANCAVAPTYQQITTVPGGVGGAVIPGPGDSFGNYFFNNRRGQTTQEFRITTTDPSWRIQAVVGGFIMHGHNHANVGASWNEPLLTYQTLGIPEQWLQGIQAAPVLQVPTNPPLDVSTRNIDVTEDEQSFFIDATFAVIPNKFKINAGVRTVNYNQLYTQQYGGTVASAPAGWYGSINGVSPVVNAAGGVSSPTGVVNPALGIATNPNATSPFPTNYAACPQHIKDAATSAQQLVFAQAGCPYQYTYNTLHETPVTPKVGGSYQLTPSDLIYVTYAEGYRPGGVNPFVPPIMCQADLAAQGLTQSPGTYQHDFVKSTEVGGKFRLFNGQAQINAAAFHITWDNVQFVESLPTCAFSYIANAATATSDGGEIQATARFHGFSFNGNLSYNQAQYSKTAMGPPRSDGKPRVILVNKGDNLGVPDWTANFGLQYDTRVMEMPVYGRIDFAYTGKYMRQTSAGTVAFNATVTPNYINGNETHIWNGRVGMYYKDLEIAGYVKNIFDSRQWINLLEGTTQYGFTGTTVTPRVVGVQANYRF
jgi:outer membrane receptor protein involved in Fe transport